MRKRMWSFILSMVLVVGSFSGNAGSIYAAESNITDSDVLVHYDMSWTTDGQLADITGNGYDADVVGMTASDFSEIGGEAVLDFHDNGYINLPDFLEAGQNEITIEMCYKIGNANNESLLTFGTNTVNTYLRFHPNEDATTYLWESVVEGVTGYQKVKGTAAYSGNYFTTATAVLKSDNTLTYYMDGEKQGVLDLSGIGIQDILDANTNRADDLIGYIGKPVYGNDPYFSGVLDEFVVYGYAASDEEIYERNRVKTELASDTSIVSRQLPSEAANGGSEWKEYMVSGNGKNGVLYAGYPYSDILVYQNMYLIMPSTTTRENPDYSGSLESNRQAVINQEGTLTLGSLLFLYPHHPGPQLRLTMDESMGSGLDYTGYERWTNYETAETGITYTNAQGTWERKTFTSRADDVTITEIKKSSTGEKINMEISLDNLSSIPKFTDDSWNQGPTHMQYKKLVDDNADYITLVGKYPGTGSFAYGELKDGGYAGVAQVIVVGGSKEKINNESTSKDSQNVGDEVDPRIKITDADAVYIIERTDRTWDMCEDAQFASMQEYELVNELKADIVAVTEKYTTTDGFDYEKALAPHVELHQTQYNAVEFSLDAAAEDLALSTEALKLKQKNSNELNLAMVERAWYAGRYAQLCCAGYSAPRLGGMWTGEWNPGWWRSSYTMDANVNLQVSGMNTGNLTDSPIGYITFVLRQLDDWMENAENTYGMHDAIKTPINTDGDVAIGIESDYNYPHQYWNSGASWMILPIYEYWQCYGNQQIPITEEMRLYENRRALGTKDGGLSEEEVQALIDRGYLDLEEDILLPLLTKQANFWEQLLTPEYYTELDGTPHYEAGKTELAEDERYLIIPCFSPENNPKSGDGYTWDAKVTMNSTMDITASRSGLQMAIDIAGIVGLEGSEDAIAKWETIISKLPEYQYDGEPGSELTDIGGGGALKEWAVNVYLENNEHRHISHMYAAWPEYETQHDEELATAIEQAYDNRNRINSGGEATTGHGWMHAALVAARLKDSVEVYNCIDTLLSSDIYYTSLQTDHNTDRSATTYCTDTSMGMVGTIQEALLFSNTGEIQILPAVPAEWMTGSINGLMARSRAEVEALSWNRETGTYTVTIRSDVAQELTVTNGLSWEAAKVEGAADAQINEGQEVVLTMEAGDLATITFSGEVEEALTDLYYIESKADQNLVVAVDGASTAAGTQLIEWENNGGTDQQWFLKSEGNGYYQFVDNKSRLVMSVQDTQVGSIIVQTEASDGDEKQLWSLEEMSDGSYRIINAASGYALSRGPVVGWLYPIIQAEVSDTDNQLWILNPLFEAPEPEKLPFTDVAETDWFYDAVYYNYFEGLMAGMSETTFAPLDTLSRAQLAIILYRMEGSPEVTYSPVFSDVAEGTWFTSAVLWAQENGIVTGYGNTGTFGPHDNITREQMAVMMYRYAAYKGYDTSASADISVFADAASVSTYADTAMKWAVGEGVITGKAGGTALDPSGNTLRAECAVIIHRFMENYNK